MANRWRSRFDRLDGAHDPVGSLDNLLDLMLVFAVGLIVALVAADGQFARSGKRPEQVEKARELPEVPEGIEAEGRGYRPVGRVFRDPESGKMYLVDEPSGARAADSDKEAPDAG